MAKLVWDNFIGGLALSTRVGVANSYAIGAGVIIDRNIGVLRDGALASQDNNVAFHAKGQVLEEGFILSYTSSTIGLTHQRDISGSYELSTTVSGISSVKSVATLIDTNSKRGCFFLYNTSTSTSEIGKVEFSSNSSFDLSGNPSKQQLDWFTSSSVIATTASALTAIHSQNQRLYMAGVQRVHYYDGNDGSMNKDKLMLPYTFRKFGSLGIYTILYTDSTAYMWDGAAPSWNFEVPLGGRFLDGITWLGVNYFLVDLGGKEIYLGRVNNDYSTKKLIKKIPATLLQMGIADDSTRFSDWKLASNDTGIFIVGIYVGHLVIFRYGYTHPDVGQPTFTMVSRTIIDSTIGTYSLVSVELPSVAYSTDATAAAARPNLSIITNENGTHKLREFRFDSDGGGNKAIFQTIDKSTPKIDNGYIKGTARKLYVYSDTASNNVTNISVVLDGTEISLETSATLTSGGVKVLNIGDRPFRTAAVKLTKELPDIYKIELEYNATIQT